MNKTFVMVKPDGVRRKLVGKIIDRFEDANFNILTMEMIKLSKKMAEKHYAEHKGKDFYENLISFVTSGPIITMVLEGESIISRVRKMLGVTDPAKAASGTIRGDLRENSVKSVTENMVHASDSTESAHREIKLFFKDLK